MPLFVKSNPMNKIWSLSWSTHNGARQFVTNLDRGKAMIKENHNIIKDIARQQIHNIMYRHQEQCYECWRQRMIKESNGSSRKAAIKAMRATLIEEGFAI